MQIRKRDPVWPFPTGETLEFDQPTTCVHVGKFVVPGVVPVWLHVSKFRRIDS